MWSWSIAINGGQFEVVTEVSEFGLVLYNCTLCSFHFYLVYMGVLPALQREGGLIREEALYGGRAPDWIFLVS